MMGDASAPCTSTDATMNPTVAHSQSAPNSSASPAA